MYAISQRSAFTLKRYSFNVSSFFLRVFFLHFFFFSLRPRRGGRGGGCREFDYVIYTSAAPVYTHHTNYVLYLASLASRRVRVDSRENEKKIERRSIGEIDDSHSLNINDWPSFIVASSPPPPPSSAKFLRNEKPRKSKRRSRSLACSRFESLFCYHAFRDEFFMNDGTFRKHAYLSHQLATRHLLPLSALVSFPFIFCSFFSFADLNCV